MDISVVIPFLNEEENIQNLVDSLNIYFQKLSHIKAEVIFVDDGSKDKSVEFLRKSNHQHYAARIVKLSKNFGSLPALYAGVLNSSGRLVVFMYADLQDPLELIEKLYNKQLEGFDIVWGERLSVDVGYSRRFSRLYAKLMRKYAVSNFPENGYDVVMFNQKVKENIVHNVESNSSIFLQILSLGFNQTAIYYNKADRKAGQSKWNFSKKMKLVIDSFVAFSYAPIRLVTIAGITFSALGLLYALYIVARKLFFDNIPFGWSALISILMIGFGITNISLGIIAEYLWRTLDVARNRKTFIVDEIIELNKK